MDAGFRGSAPLHAAIPPLPSPFMDSPINVPPIRPRTVRVNAPSTASSIPVVPATFPSTTGPVKATRKKWPVALGIVGIVLCVIASCLGVIIGLPVVKEMLATVTLAPTTLTPPTPIVNQPTKTSTPLPQIDFGEFSLTINNQSPYDVCYIFISPVDNDNWGDDWLGLEDVIAPGETMTFDVPEGAHDFLAETCEEATLATGWDLVSDVTYDIGGAGLVPVSVYNDLEEVVCFLFISLVTSDDWGDDWLGEIESLPSGGSRIFFVSPDIYDFSAMNCDEQELGYQYDTPVYDNVEWVIH